MTKIFSVSSKILFFELHRNTVSTTVHPEVFFVFWYDMASPIARPDYISIYFSSRLYIYTVPGIFLGTVKEIDLLDACVFLRGLDSS